MKKFLILFASFALFTTCFGASGISVFPKKATEVFIPIGNNMKISLNDLSVIKVKDYEKMTGKHMNFFQKTAFKAAQKRLRNSFSTDGTTTNTKLLKAVVASDSLGFNGGWLALGFFLGLIGVLLSYILNGEQDVKKNRQKWAWIGFGAAIVLYLLLLI